MTHILKKIDVNNFYKVFRRYKHHKEHWSVLKKKNKGKDKALKHFDDFYTSVYGTSSWERMREAMLKENNKHIAIVNNFSEHDAITEKLSLLGAMNLKSLYEIHKKNYDERAKFRASKTTSDKIYKINQPVEMILQNQRQSEVQSIFPESYQVPNELLAQKEVRKNSNDDNDDDELLKSKNIMDPVQLRSIEENVKVHQDENRIIKSSVGLTSSCLYEYVPTTKLKGLDDYVLESDHYNHYAQGADFSVKVEKEAILNIPEHLKIYTFESGNDSRFPSPRRAHCNVYDYYLMDGCSILPVLALDLQMGDTVLDMCAAPGGKSLAMLQTLMTYVLVANDSSHSRLNHMNNIFQDYLGDFDAWKDKLFLTNHDAREIEDKHIYNKILVDVPCTTDRHNLHNDENNIFSPTRVKERLRLPELQTEILLQALKIVAPGGTVVYSTCSLSPIQNDGVVQMALKKCSEEIESVMIVKNLDEALAPLRFIYKFATNCGLKYGHVAIPTKNNNWGPMYFCKIVKLP
ncbi:hypothetical protein PV325_001574 [Microctonus aethiopoides]|nr:hypothetical protein PV325_001574 [Microctonus aethiopoides]